MGGLVAALPALGSLFGSAAAGAGAAGAGGAGLGSLASALGGSAIGGLTQGILPQLLRGQNPFTGPMSAYGLASSMFKAPTQMAGLGSGGDLAVIRQRLQAAGLTDAQINQILGGGPVGGGGLLSNGMNVG